MFRPWLWHRLRKYLCKIDTGNRQNRAYKGCNALIILCSWYRWHYSPSRFIMVLSDGFALIWHYKIYKDHDNVGWWAYIKRKCPTLSLLLYLFVVVCLRRLYCNIQSNVSHRFWESCYFFCWFLRYWTVYDEGILWPFYTLFSLCRNVGKCWRYKMLVRYIRWSVCLTSNIILNYMWLYLISLSICRLMIEKIFVLRLIIILSTSNWGGGDININH